MDTPTTTLGISELLTSMGRFLEEMLGVCEHLSQCTGGPCQVVPCYPRLNPTPLCLSLSTLNMLTIQACLCLTADSSADGVPSLSLLWGQEGISSEDKTP